MLYRHCDGYPGTEHGVVAALEPILVAFQAKRGMSDIEYLAAHTLTCLKNEQLGADKGVSFIGYGICGDKELHGDIEWYYAVYPSRLKVYTADAYGGGTQGWPGLTLYAEYVLTENRLCLDQQAVTNAL